MYANSIVSAVLFVLWCVRCELNKKKMARPNQENSYILWNCKQFITAYTFGTLFTNAQIYKGSMGLICSTVVFISRRFPVSKFPLFGHAV